MDIAERVSAAVPTAADAWTAVGTITVPSGAKRIKKLKFAVAPDWGLTAGSVRMAPVFRLQGSGLSEQNPHEYLTVFAGHAEVTTGGITMNDLEMVYDVDIPVSEGGTINVDCNSLDEVITAGTAIANVIFDTDASKAANSMAQFIDAAGTTTADVFSAIGTVRIPKTEGAKDPKKIKKLIIAVAVDQGTSAVSLRCVPVIRLSGAGIKGSGTLQYVGRCGYTGEIGTTPSQGIDFDGSIAVIDVDIDINAGGEFNIEQMFITETPTASTIAVGIIYA